MPAAACLLLLSLVSVPALAAPVPLAVVATPSEQSMVVPANDHGAAALQKRYTCYYGVCNFQGGKWTW